MAKLTHQFDVERRNGKHVAMLTLDLGDFEALSDNFSHAQGSELLQKMEQSIRERLRNGDSVARVDGNSFIVLLESLHSPDNAEKVADVLIENVSQSLSLIPEHTEKLGVNVHVDFFQKDDDYAH
ncbi:MAG: GGDEF domain-containing protein [Methylococcales bacterium]|nr:GGDEF domain-containing protein [Methylococcales bacterium]MDD5755513.1 GGDEF domain-containing protein [Methylococcales bacterium]